MGGVFKVRRKLLANSQLQVGKQGNVVDSVLFGNTTGCMVQATTVTMVTGSLLAPQAAVGDMVFLTAGSLPADVYIQSACITAASTITASYYNAGSATATAVTVSAQYFIVSAS